MGAEAIYRAILMVDPTNADALHLLGLISLEKGDGSASVGLLQEAVRRKPGVALFHSNLGNALGRLGRWQEAVAAHRRAIELDSAFAPAYNNLANALRAQGLLEQAIVAYRRACEVRPHFAEAWTNLGIALTEAGLTPEALRVLTHALELKADFPPALDALGTALCQSGDLHGALSAFERAWVLVPDNPGICTNRAVALHDLGRLDEAMEGYRRSLALDANRAEPWINIGNLLADEHRLGEAIDSYRRALALQPDHPGARYNLGIALLMRGELSEGFQYYEFRWDGAKEARGAARDWPYPRWKGEALEGRTILLWAEQGYGDTLQFVRYAPLIAARGAKVILECQGDLVRLLSATPGVFGVIARGEPVPMCDFQCPLLSVPLLFGTTQDSVPAAVPYVHARPTLVRQVSHRFVRDDQLRVGLVWRGANKSRIDRRRSLTLADLQPLAAVEGARFYSLQVGPEEAGPRILSRETALIDLAPGIRDFADTAAMVEHLDLVIAVDTAVVHLAGALGKPVWLLCRFESEWRWMLDRHDSPWYPSLRIFRQHRRGEWGSVVERVASALQEARFVRRPTDRPTDPRDASAPSSRCRAP